MEVETNDPEQDIEAIVNISSGRTTVVKSLEIAVKYIIFCTNLYF